MVSNAARAAGNDVATSAATKPQVLDTATVGGKAATAAEAVDMGGSVLWAPWNVGAARAEEYGAYFAWGEINGRKESYDWEFYVWMAE